MSPLVSEKKEGLPILIVDKIGVIGHDLSSKLAAESVVVLVTQNEPNIENVLYVPFERDVPKIPDNLYSHIFIIDDGRDLTIELLSPFLKKAAEDKAVFCFCTGIENQINIPEEILEYKKTKVIFFGDVFPAKNVFGKSIVNKFINSSKNKGKITIPQDGMSMSRPVFWDDSIVGILEAAFGTSQEKIYYDFPKHGVTLLSFAHIIQRINPEVKIDFSNNEKVSEADISREGKYLLTDNYSLAEKMNQLKIVKEKFYQKESPEKEPVKENLSLPKIPLTYTRLTIFSIILFLFLPLITTLFFTFTAFLTLDFAKTNLANGKFFLNLSKNSFDFAQNFSKALIYETDFFQISPFSKLSESIEKNRKELNDLSDYYNALGLLNDGKIAEGTALLKNFVVFGQSENLSFIDPKVQNFISQTVELWPQIFGAGSKKTYLILFQNSLTPRPTGGLIETFGLIGFNNGKISDFKIYNTKDSDKNLKGHVEPPFAIRRYLPSNNLLMRDSNFNPDFIQTAASSSFFANLEENQKVDGVIGVDSVFIDKLAKELNIGIDPSSVKNTIEKIYAALEKNNSFKILLSKNFINFVQEKDILFEFNDQSVESPFLSNNFSSSILDTRQASPKIINDFISIQEADLGAHINKVERNVKDKVNVSDTGEVSDNLSLEYKNGGDSDYKNYLRFIVPLGAKLEKIKIDGQDADFTNAITDPSVYEARGFTPPQKLEVEQYADLNKNFFGFLVVIPKNGSKRIDISYSFTPISLSGLSDFSYNLKFFKQPGIPAYPLGVSVSYPSSFATSDKISIAKITGEDFDLNFNFSQK